MVFIDYLVNNYVFLFELVALLIMLRISAHVSSSNKKYTITVVCLLFIESIASALEIWTQSFESYNVARPMLTACKYSIYPVIIFILMQITIEKKTSKLKTLLYLIPEIICVPLFFTSQWTKLVVYYTDTNHYKGGPLMYLPYILFGIYMALFLVYNIIYFKHYAKSTRHVVIFIVAGSLLGIIVYMSYLEQYDFTDIFTAGIVLYYLCFYIHLAKIDPLTSLLNRQSYYQDMKSHNDSITGAASIDMNNLKTINDSQGHEAGDLAIITISDVLWKNCGRKGIVYRIGGDEFVVLYSNASEEEVKESISNMRTKMSETAYSCAYGYHMRLKGESIDDVVNQADHKMYEDKATLKRRKDDR